MSKSPKTNVEMTVKGYVGERCSPPPPPSSEMIKGSINFNNHVCSCKSFNPELLGINILEQNGLLTVELKYDEKIVSKDSLQIFSGRF